MFFCENLVRSKLSEGFIVFKEEKFVLWYDV